MAACNNSKTTEWIFIKLGTGELMIFVDAVDLCLQANSIKGTLYGAHYFVHAFYVYVS